jgi:hypothetical protein
MAKKKKRCKPPDCCKWSICWRKKQKKKKKKAKKAKASSTAWPNGDCPGGSYKHGQSCCKSVEDDGYNQGKRCISRFHHGTEFQQSETLAYLNEAVIPKNVPAEPLPEPEGEEEEQQQADEDDKEFEKESGVNCTCCSDSEVDSNGNGCDAPPTWKNGALQARGCTPIDCGILTVAEKVALTKDACESGFSDAVYSPAVGGGVGTCQRISGRRDGGAAVTPKNDFCYDGIDSCSDEAWAKQQGYT